MKTKPFLLLTSILLSCAAAPAQDTPPGPGGPPLAPPRGDQRPPLPPGQRPPDGREDRPRENRGPRDGEGRLGAGPRDGQGRPDGGPREGGLREAGPRDGQNRPEGGPREGEGQRSPRHEDHQGPRDGQPHGLGAEGDRHPEAVRTPQPFLGVSAAPVPPPLAAQLGLQEGFGLLVVEVMPESPAGKAGLQKFDVLRQLNDQQLVDVAQLTALVRGAGKGKEVSLTVIRKAQEQKIAVTVGEHVAPARGPSSPGFNPEMFHERFRALQEKGHDLMERMHEQGDRPHPPGPARGPEGAAPRHSGGPEEGLPPTAAISPEELLREAQPAGGAQIRVSSETSSTMLDGTKSRLRLKDGEGEIEVVAKDGQRTLTARDPQGAILFSGPVNTAEERAAVPENFRQKLAEIRVRPGNGEPREIQ